MLILKLNRKDVEAVIYDYFPEDREDYGTVKLNLKDNEFEVLKKAEESSTLYIMHAYQGLIRMKEENDFSNTRTVAWH